VTKDPDSGIQNGGTYRAALKATDRAVVRMVARAGGAGGYQHWVKHNKRKTAMPIAIVVGAAPVVMFTGAQKLEEDCDELGVAGGLHGAGSLNAIAGKILIAVSEDIDPDNLDAVMWSI